MSYISIGSSEIESGKPVTSTTMGKVKDDLDDHESRLQIIESGVGTSYPPLTFSIKGSYSINGAVTNILKTTTNFSIQITGIRLIIDQAGSSGTTEVDVKFSRSGGAYTSLLITKPSVGYASGNDAISTNGVVDPTYSTLIAGDIIRLDSTSVQSDGRGFIVRIDYTGA